MPLTKHGSISSNVRALIFEVAPKTCLDLGKGFSIVRGGVSGELNLSDASAIHKHNRIGFCILCVRCYYYGVVLLFELNREERLLLIHTSLGRVWI